MTTAQTGVLMSLDLGRRSLTTSTNGVERPKKPLKHICFADIDGEGCFLQYG